VKSDELAGMLMPVFCDKEPKNIIKLRQTIANMEGVEKLVYDPQFEKVVSFDDLICSLQKVRFMPSLIVVEPFSVKDLNLELISAHIKEWNFDCIFLLHYNQLVKMIENPFKAKHLEVAFGKTAADRLRAVADRLNPQQKESFIVNTFVDGLKSLKGWHSVIVTYYQGKDIYYLVFTTRYVPRYRLMKEIMISAGYDEAGITNQEPAPAEKANLLVQAGLF
jgi:three-Cys-motif partner protein